jgi:hypothetical protein
MKGSLSVALLMIIGCSVYSQEKNAEHKVKKTKTLTNKISSYPFFEDKNQNFETEFSFFTNEDDSEKDRLDETEIYFTRCLENNAILGKKFIGLQLKGIFSAVDQIKIKLEKENQMLEKNFDCMIDTLMDSFEELLHLHEKYDFLETQERNRIYKNSLNMIRKIKKCELK